MIDFPSPLDLSRVKVYPLADRPSLSTLDAILVDPGSTPPPCPIELQPRLMDCVARIRAARERGASVMLLYGAQLVKNGLLDVVNELVHRGWITHLATNGAGTIHDWEVAFLGRTEESVRAHVATGTFGTWDETGRALNLAVLSGALRGEGYGRALGRFIEEDGCTLPSATQLEHALRAGPGHPLAPARAELLQTMRNHQLTASRITVAHPNKAHSIIAHAFRRNLPLTVHPGVGYDMIATHPMFSGAAIGRAVQADFALFSRSVDSLEGGVILSLGSDIMAPQVFEQSLICVNNLRLQAGRPAVEGHTIYLLDFQDDCQWDWSQGEPPKDHPADNLCSCRSFARLGGSMHCLQADTSVFLRNLLPLLRP